MLAVVVTDVAGEGEYQFERRKFGAAPGELHVLAQWLVQQDVEEVVMESTAQYWKPVWGALERHWKPARQQRDGASKRCGTLHLCQAKSNRGPRGRKNDFADGERMIKRTFNPGFRIGLHQKDLNLALQGAKSIGVALPQTAGAAQLMQACAAHGWDTLDHSALVKALELMAAHTVAPDQPAGSGTTSTARTLVRPSPLVIV